MYEYFREKKIDRKKLCYFQNAVCFILEPFLPDYFSNFYFYTLMNLVVQEHTENNNK